MKRFIKVFPSVSPYPQRRSFTMKFTKKGSYFLWIAALLVFSVVASAQSTCGHCYEAALDWVQGGSSITTCLAQLQVCLKGCR